tara:strand:+ start:104 stop:1645 length:1542 start_codon:yes stop_codon:yes gene_type:complete
METWQYNDGYQWVDVPGNVSALFDAQDESPSPLPKNYPSGWSGVLDTRIMVKDGANVPVRLRRAPTDPPVYYVDGRRLTQASCLALDAQGAARDGPYIYAREDGSVTVNGKPATLVVEDESWAQIRHECRTSYVWTMTPFKYDLEISVARELAPFFPGLPNLMSEFDPGAHAGTTFADFLGFRGAYDIFAAYQAKYSSVAATAVDTSTNAAFEAGLANDETPVDFLVSGQNYRLLFNPNALCFVGATRAPPCVIRVENYAHMMQYLQEREEQLKRQRPERLQHGDPLFDRALTAAEQMLISSGQPEQYVRQRRRNNYFWPAGLTSGEQSSLLEMWSLYLAQISECQMQRVPVDNTSPFEYRPRERNLCVELSNELQSGMPAERLNFIRHTCTWLTPGRPTDMCIVCSNGCAQVQAQCDHALCLRCWCKVSACPMCRAKPAILRWASSGVSSTAGTAGTAGTAKKKQKTNVSERIRIEAELQRAIVNKDVNLIRNLMNQRKALQYTPEFKQFVL